MGHETSLSYDLDNVFNHEEKSFPEIFASGKSFGIQVLYDEEIKVSAWDWMLSKNLDDYVKEVPIERAPGKRKLVSERRVSGKV